MRNPVSVSKTLRVLVFLEGEYLVGQCLEYDIAVQAKSIKELKDRFSRMVKHHVALAFKQSTMPFTGLTKPEQTYEAAWQAAVYTIN